MKKHTKTIECNTYYHIYNRGINGESIFKNENNYGFFLLQYSKFIEPIANTYAYCLLGNHFHFLIKTKSEKEIVESIDKLDGKEKWISESIDLKSGSFYISNQFAKFFNSYTQSINKAENRTGSLFESPFRRIEVSSNSYFSHLVYYIHNNPKKHGFVPDFRKYRYSSYNSHLTVFQTKLKREELLEWFGNREQYELFHNLDHNESEIRDLIIEF